MVPPDYLPFFAASMGAAAALLGLLFVAVSIAPERTVGARAPVERQMVADSVFTALINAFFISMGGTIPDLNLGSITLPLSVLALAQTLHVGRVLWPRRLTVATLSRRLGLVLVGLVIYGLEVANALQLLGRPTQPAPVVVSLTGLLFGVYGFAIVRSWELLGARRGLLARLSPLFEAEPDGMAPAPDPTPPSAPNPGHDDAGPGRPRKR